MGSRGSADGPEVRRARETLADRYLEDPDVRLIDVGSEPGEGKERTVLRVHVRDAAARSRLGLPENVDGIPVRVVVADYRCEG